MAIESAADRLVFLSVDDFGVTASYTPVAGGASTDVPGIFDKEYFEIEAGAEVGVAGTQPRFVCRTEDLSGGGSFGDALVIGTVTYKARVVRPDGTGMTALYLEEQ